VPLYLSGNLIERHLLANTFFVWASKCHSGKVAVSNRRNVETPTPPPPPTKIISTLKTPRYHHDHHDYRNNNLSFGAKTVDLIFVNFGCWLKTKIIVLKESELEEF
jgi:hypothetical protein